MSGGKRFGLQLNPPVVPDGPGRTLGGAPMHPGEHPRAPTGEPGEQPLTPTPK